MKSVFKAARSFALGAAACLPLLAPTLPFLITNEQGSPIPIPQGDKNLLLPMFLDQAKAQKELDAFNKANPAAKARVTPIPMNLANDKVNEINKKFTDKKLVAPVISSDADMAKAVELLRKQGVSEKDINEGLSVPVFFSKPFITINKARKLKCLQPISPLPWAE
jgi:hypothetical protein